MRGLYAIVDTRAVAARGLDALAFADALLAVRPAALQLRVKDLPPRETLALLRALAPRCRRAAVPLVANDRPDFAMLAGCDLVHVGQTDMPIESVRRIARGLRIGVSTHTMAQLETALAARPAYVAFGPVFETTTKADADAVVGVEGLRAASARARAAGVPLVAIGGITRPRARELVRIVDAVAVVADLVPAVTARDALREATARARELHALWTPTPALAGVAR